MRCFDGLGIGIGKSMLMVSAASKILRHAFNLEGSLREWQNSRRLLEVRRNHVGCENWPQHPFNDSTT